MSIHSINGLPPSRNTVKSSKGRTEASDTKKTDRIQISSEARQKLSVDALVQRVKEYLGRLSEVRRDKVDAVAQNIREGYQLDSEKLSLIAERIQK